QKRPGHCSPSSSSQAPRPREEGLTLQGRCTGHSRETPLGVSLNVSPYCPTVKSILFRTVPAASRISTCHAPLASAGIVLRLHVLHGDPPTASDTSPTCSSPWNQTWCSDWPLPPVTRIHSTTVPTLSGKAVPVS